MLDLPVSVACSRRFSGSHDLPAPVQLGDGQFGADKRSDPDVIVFATERYSRLTSIPS